MIKIKILIPMIVGSIIGYITNWLAIKMLFRPHKKIRIMGIGIPFTPGLIPKERERIASNIGRSVSEELLTPQVIAREISAQNRIDKLKSNIREKIEVFKKDKRSLEEFLQGILKDKYKDKVFSTKKI